MMNLSRLSQAKALFLALAVFLMPLGTAFAQEGESASSPAGLGMLVLFLGIAGIGGVFVIHWGQSVSEEDE